MTARLTRSPRPAATPSPFAPTVSIQIGDRGTTKQNGYPPFVVKITQPAGRPTSRHQDHAADELNTNNSAYKLCTQAQADADTCPRNSKFGDVVAKSPFLSEQLGGPGLPAPADRQLAAWACCWTSGAGRT